MRFNKNKEYSLHKNTDLFPKDWLEHQYQYHLRKALRPRLDVEFRSRRMQLKQ